MPAGMKRLRQADGGFVGYTDERLVYPAGLPCGLHLQATADGGAEWLGAYFQGIQFASADCSGQAYLKASLEVSYLLANCFVGSAPGPFYAAKQPVQVEKVDVFSTLEGHGCNKGTYLHALPVYALDVVSVPPPPTFPVSLSAR